MKDPQEALTAARRAAAAQPGEPDVAELTDRGPAGRRLVEWAIIEPDVARIYSTRRYGKPITLFKRLLVRMLRQYLVELSAQQSRFNSLVAAELLHLEERIGALESARDEASQSP